MKYIYCNPQTLERAAQLKIKPAQFSKVLLDEYYVPYLVAGYDDESYTKLCAIAEEDWGGSDAFWRSCGGVNFGLDEQRGLYGTGYKPRVMRKVGFYSYICDQYQVSADRNVAAFILTLAQAEGKTPVEFWNSLSSL